MGTLALVLLISQDLFLFLIPAIVVASLKCFIDPPLNVLKKDIIDRERDVKMDKDMVTLLSSEIQEGLSGDV